MVRYYAATVGYKDEYDILISFDEVMVFMRGVIYHLEIETQKIVLNYQYIGNPVAKHNLT